MLFIIQWIVPFTLQEPDPRSGFDACGPAGTVDNSPVIHRRVSGDLEPSKSRRDDRFLYLLGRPSGNFIFHPDSPAINRRAIFKRPSEALADSVNNPLPQEVSRNLTNSKAITCFLEFCRPGQDSFGPSRFAQRM